MITVEVNKVEQPKDIFFKGNIVESRNEIVIVGEPVNGEPYLFTGQVIISHSGLWQRGHYIKYWPKECFTQFTGTITITSNLPA